MDSLAQTCVNKIENLGIEVGKDDENSSSGREKMFEKGEKLEIKSVIGGNFEMKEMDLIFMKKVHNSQAKLNPTLATQKCIRQREIFLWSPASPNGYGKRPRGSDRGKSQILLIITERFLTKELHSLLWKTRLKNELKRMLLWKMLIKKIYNRGVMTKSIPVRHYEDPLLEQPRSEGISDNARINQVGQEIQPPNPLVLGNKEIL